MVEGSPQAQVGNFFHKLPYAVINAFPGKYKIIPDCCIEIGSGGRPIGTKQRSEYIKYKERVVFGRAGFVTRHCPLHVVERSVSKMGSSDAANEIIKDYKCKGSQYGCEFGTRVCRVECDGMRGIVIYQKVKKDSELGVIPVAHSGHDLFPYHSS